MNDGRVIFGNADSLICRCGAPSGGTRHRYLNTEVGPPSVLSFCGMRSSASLGGLLTKAFSSLVLLGTGALGYAAQNPSPTPLQATETVQTPHDVQTSNDPESLMILAARLNGLTGEGIKPWHLKASFKLLDEQGNTLEDGHIEEFWAGPHKARLTYTSTDYAQTTYWTDTSTMRSGDKQMPPVPVLEMRNQFVQPLPDPAYLEHQSFDMRPQQAGSTKLDCLAVKAPPGSIGLPALLGHVYCLDEVRPLLRISAMGQAPDHVDQYVRNKVINFEGRYIPQEHTHGSIRQRPDHLPTWTASGGCSTPSTMLTSRHRRMQFCFRKESPSLPASRKETLSATPRLNIPRTPRPPVSIRHRCHRGHHRQRWPCLRCARNQRLLHAAPGRRRCRAQRVGPTSPTCSNGEAVEVDTTINVVFSLSH